MYIFLVWIFYSEIVNHYSVLIYFVAEQAYTNEFYIDIIFSMSDIF
jgi:hypothetical protein